MKVKDRSVLQHSASSSQQREEVGLSVDRRKLLKEEEDSGRHHRRTARAERLPEYNDSDTAGATAVLCPDYRCAM